MNELLRIHGLIESRRKSDERICLEIRQLFHEWPSNPLKKEEEVSPNLPKDQPDDGLSSTERAELALVSNVLLKAQKVREGKKKNSPHSLPEKLSITVTPATVTTTTTTTKNPCHKPPIAFTVPKPPIAFTVPKSRLSRAPNSAKSTKLQHSKSNNNKENNSVTRERSKPSKRELMEKYSSRRKTPSASRVTPAHVSAPFKTNPNLHEKRSLPRSRSVDSRQSSATAVSVRDPSASRRQTATEQSDASLVPSHKNKSSSSNAHQLVAPKKTETVFAQYAESVSPGSDKVLTVSDKLFDTVADVNNDSLSHPEMDKISPSVPLTDEMECEAEKPPEPPDFNLEKDGYLLKMPLSWRKAYKTNRLFRRRLDTETWSDSHRRLFLHRLQSITCDSTHHLRSDIIQRSNTMADEYCKLRMSLDKLDIGCVTASSSYSVKLYHYKILEHILSKFYDLEDDYNNLEMEMGMVSITLTENEIPQHISKIRRKICEISSEAEMDEGSQMMSSGPLLYQSRRSLLTYQRTYDQLLVNTLKRDALRALIPELVDLTADLQGYEPEAQESVNRMMLATLDDDRTNLCRPSPSPRVTRTDKSH